MGPDWQIFKGFLETLRRFNAIQFGRRQQALNHGSAFFLVFFRPLTMRFLSECGNCDLLPKLVRNQFRVRGYKTVCKLIRRQIAN